MQRISRETETKLVRLLDKVASFVAEGQAPNDAIIKVAQDGELPVGQVQLMVQAYNNARFNHQRKSASLVAEKVASFDLADPNKIFEVLYPANVKEAHAKTLSDPNEVSDEYTRPPKPLVADSFAPSFGKAASVYRPVSSIQHEPKYYMKKAHSLLKQLEVEHAEKRRLMNAARDKVASTFADLELYFQRLDHAPFDHVKEASILLYGMEAEPIFNHLADASPRLTKEIVMGKKAAVDRSRAPYTLIEACLEKVAEYTHRFNDLGKFSKQAGQASLSLMKQFMPQTEPPLRGSLINHRHTEKQAADMGMMASPLESAGRLMLAAEAGKQILPHLQPKAPEKLEQKSLLSLMDPAHEQKLRGVRAQATFHDLMGNDEYLQGADPQHATKLYNEIGQIAPRAMDQPLLMRALLRRYLSQGQVDPHDVQQLAEIETKLKGREAPIDAPKPTGGLA